MTRPVPAILDTDIGGDIDDTWALAMLLKCPELEPLLIATDTGDTEYRARIAARLLEIAGRTNIPVGVGRRFPGDGPRERQRAWVKDYDLARYRGTVHADGVQAIIDTIRHSPQPVTLICIGPMPNIRAALEREPRIAGNAHFVGMHGSFNLQHETNLNNRHIRKGAKAETNVFSDIPAPQAVFAAPWLSMTITPLDTCGLVFLDGERYAKLRDSKDPVMQAVMENYRIWSPQNDESDPDTHSSILFDTVAVYLAFAAEDLVMEEMGVRVDDRGFTVEDPTARQIQVAIAWKDLDAYCDVLTNRLLRTTQSASH
jgi:inosine-uridine nucleoside N-ribohydrolase